MLVAALALLGGVFVAGSPAYAHVSLVSSDPKDDARLGKPPAEVTLVFNEQLDPALTKVSVAVDGTVVATTPQVNGSKITVPLQGERGRYRVAYRVVAGDGHPVEDMIEFTVRRGAPASGASAGSAPAKPPKSSPSSDSAAIVNGPTGDAKSRTVTRSWVWPAVGLGGLGLLLALAYVLVVGSKRTGQGSEDEGGNGPEQPEAGHSGSQ
ncbi:MAG: copper resistance CopC family protein [Micromonosporaceae bacterium]